MDNYRTPIGNIEISVIGHASLLIKWNGKNIYSDPYSEVENFKGMPKADLILITHNHYDHFDRKAIDAIKTDTTHFIVGKNVGDNDGRYRVLCNGESDNFEGIQIIAVPSYNVNRKNDKGEHFHPKGEGNGYILDFGGFKVYIAGDTEPISEMKFITNIDIAFLPKNLPYTMTDEEFIQVANLIKPRYLYPIHFFELNIANLLRMIDTGITLLNTNKL